MTPEESDQSELTYRLGAIRALIEEEMSRAAAVQDYQLLAELTGIADEMADLISGIEYSASERGRP